ncbi:MAG: PAS domain S-box protein [Nitrososphaeria archaeon]|nr:PAS domain S-box protein [Nitrososphaeria archaeon]
MAEDREEKPISVFKVSYLYATATFFLILVLDILFLSQKINLSNLIEQELSKGFIYIIVAGTLTYILLQKNIILRRDLELSLRASKHVLNSFLKFAKGIAFQVDLRRTQTFLFGDFELVTLYSKDDLIKGKIKWNQIVHQDDRLKFEENLQKLYTIPNYIIEEEYRIVRRDNQIRWMRGFSQNFSYKGKIIGYNRILYDVTEEKVAMERVNFQANIIENINDAIVILNENFIIEHMNKAAEKIYGWHLSEAQGHYMFELFNSEPINGDFKKIINMLKDKNVFEHDFVHTKKDGTKIYVNMRFNTIYGQGGKILGYITIHQDITEKKIMAKALEEREKLFRTITENMYEIVGLVDVEGRIEYFSPSFEKILGHPSSDLIGKRVLDIDLVEKDDLKNMIHKFLENSKGFPRLKAEARIKNSKGEYVWFEITANPLSSEKEQLEKVVFSAREISERKRLEEEVKAYTKNLEESEKGYRTIFENTGTAMAIVEEDTTISLVNTEFERILECDKSDIIGKSFIEIIAKEDIERLLNYHYQRRVSPDKAPRNFEFRFYTKKGELRYGFATVALLPDSRKSLVSIIDITEMKKKEQQVKAYTENLEKLVEEKSRELREKERMAALGEAATLIGHDLRNPLQALKNNLFIIEQRIKNFGESNESEDIINKLKAMYREVDYMNKIVLDLQDYAAPIKSFETKIELEKIIEEAMKGVIVPENIKATLEIDQSVSHIKADFYIIKRVLGNLILNAIQAMPEGGTLTIIAKSSNDDLILEVKDTGVGIPEENIKKIFTPFFTTKSKGQGLGLAVCKRLVETLGGNISVESKVGEGTKFIIKLPKSI